jgi:hypothetical protein
MTVPNARTLWDLAQVLHPGRSASTPQVLDAARLR